MLVLLIVVIVVVIICMVFIVGSVKVRFVGCKVIYWSRSGLVV